MSNPNVICRHCGYSWFHEGKLPRYCINCYSKDIQNVPSPLEQKLEALEEKLRKQKRKKEKMKGVTKLK